MLNMRLAESEKQLGLDLVEISNPSFKARSHCNSSCGGKTAAKKVGKRKPVAPRRKVVKSVQDYLCSYQTPDWSN